MKAFTFPENFNNTLKDRILSKAKKMSNSITEFEMYVNRFITIESNLTKKSIHMSKPIEEENIEIDYEEKYKNLAANIKKYHNEAKEAQLASYNDESYYDALAGRESLADDLLLTIKSSTSLNKYEYTGDGLALGSTGIILARSLEEASSIMKSNMQFGLEFNEEGTKLIESDIKFKPQLINFDSGDY